MFISRTIPINPEALKREFERQSISLSHASTKMGHAESYLSHKIHDKRVSVADSILLENLFNISPAFYKKEELDNIVQKSNEKVSTADESTVIIREGGTTTIDYDKLSEVIYKAVYDAAYEAVKRAWENS